MWRKRLPAQAGHLILGLAIVACSAVSGQSPDATGGRDIEPKELVRQMAEYLGQQPTYQCKITAVMEITARGLQNKMESVTAFRVDRPSRFAMVLESGFNGATMVCDGQTLITHLPMLERYSRSEAPDDIAIPLTGPSAQALAMTGPMGGIAPIGGDSYYSTIMTAVTDATYAGKEDVEGVACHHLRFEQSGMGWELWVEQGDRPLPRKIVFDLTDQLAETNPIFKDAKMDCYTLFSDWDFDPTFTDQDFRFKPPAGATQVDDLLDDMFESDLDDQPHPSLGKSAPVFKAQDLQQKTIDLADHFGEEVVILDFWATWCGPCVDALPKIASVAQQYRDRGVRFYAINVGEDAEGVREFLTTAELDIDVLLDPDAAVANQFEAEAIPQTVLVGLDGKVQVVHVGLGPGLKKQLSGELDRLLKGEDLASETLHRAEQAMQELAANDFGTTLAWSYPSRAIGVASDAVSSRIYAVDAAGEVVVLSADGSEIDSTTMGPGGKIRSATLVVGDDPEFVTYGSWGETVQAFSAAGSELWNYTHGQGIDDVWPADLDGDGADEIIIGYNGNTGLHVLDQRGTLLWKFTGIGNVWHVAAGDVDGDGQTEVVTTSAQGRVHVFSADGEKEKDMEVSVYANMVRATAGSPYAPGQILVGGSADDGHSLMSVSSAGDSLFELSLPLAGTDYMDEMILAEGQHWAAVAMRGGLVHIVDISSGELVATVTLPGRRSDVGWLQREGKLPLLLTASGKAIAAYEIKGDSE